jgi:predicted transport protein
MKLLSLQNNKLHNISIKPFKLEKEIQQIVENNLFDLFSLELIKSEFTIKNFRIDTLGFDRENKSFVIIEYKKDKNYSVIDQGYTYLSLMLNNKSDFILEYNENCKGSLLRTDVDWTQSRVIFISPQFSDYQTNSINFKDVPFELWEIKRFENNLISMVQHKPTSSESISTAPGDSNNMVKKVTKEVKVYTEESHIDYYKSETNKELYLSLRERIINLGEVEIMPRSQYIGFKRKTNFVDVSFQKNALWMWINLPKGKLDDPKGITRDVSNIGHYGNGDYDLKVTPKSDLDYIMFLINQSYKHQE